MVSFTPRPLYPPSPWKWSPVDCVWNVMAHAQKPDFVFRRNERVHLNRRGVRISGSNAGYTMFRGSVKGTGYPLYSPFSPSLPLPCVTVCHHISAWLYPVLRRLWWVWVPVWTFRRRAANPQESSPWLSLWCSYCLQGYDAVVFREVESSWMVATDQLTTPQPCGIRDCVIPRLEWCVFF